MQSIKSAGCVLLKKQRISATVAHEELLIKIKSLGLA